jgi:hypothetical protein
MGLIWTESFESDKYLYKKTADGAYASSASDGRSGTARTGSYGFHHGPNPNYHYTVALGATAQDDLVTVGFAAHWYLNEQSGSHDLLQFRSGANALVTIHKVGSTTLHATRGPSSGGTLLGSVTIPAIAHSNWYCVEAQMKLHDTTGTVTLKLDGLTVLAITAADTNPGAYTAIDAIDLGGGGYSWYSDDVYVTNEQGSVNTGFLGAPKIEFRTPDGAGVTTQGVPSSGVNNWDLVNDNPANTVGYVDLVSTNDQDTYIHTDMGGSYLGTTPVKAVAVWAFGIKTDAGARNITPLARLSGTEIAADPIAMTTSNAISGAVVGDIFETKPGGGAWTVADVDDAEFGLRAT